VGVITAWLLDLVFGQVRTGGAQKIAFRIRVKKLIPRAPRAEPKPLIAAGNADSFSMHR
jgi:hypothetical protein